MADRPDTPGDPDHLRAVPERLYSDATSLRHSQDEGPWTAGTRRPALLLSPYRKGGEGRFDDDPVPLTRVRTAGQLPVPPPSRRRLQATQQNRDRLPPS